jgi:hypothetical protein
MKTKSISRRRITKMSGGTSDNTDPKAINAEIQYYNILPEPDMTEYKSEIENFYQNMKKKYNTNTVPINKHIDRLAKVYKAGLTVYKNMFYKENLNIPRLNITINVLIRCQKNDIFGTKSELRAIYFIGKDTRISKCTINPCYDIKNLYKLSEDGKELLETPQITIEEINDKNNFINALSDYIEKCKHIVYAPNSSSQDPETAGTQNEVVGGDAIVFSSGVLGLTLKDKHGITTFVRKSAVNLRNLTEGVGNVAVGTGKLARKVLLNGFRLGAPFLFRRGGKRTRRKNTHQKRNMKKNNSRRRRN